MSGKKDIIKKGSLRLFDFIMKAFVPGYGKQDEPQIREKSGRVAGAVGIVTNFLLFVIKLIAGFVSGSVAIMADAVNNLTDSGSSIVMLVGFKLAGKPADEKHPFGHARIEYLSGVIVSFIVLFLGLELGITSIEKIITPQDAEFSAMALAVLVISILIKLWQCFFYRSVGKTIHSDTVFATSSDSRNDVIATSVVLLGAVITRFTSLNLDGYLGLAVAVFIVISGVKLIMETGNPLLGMAPDEKLVKTIYEKILSYEGIFGIHDLTVHNYGEGKCFASVHCEVPAERDILVSHDIIDNIERDFQRDLGIHLVIHLDPIVTEDERTNKLREQIRKLLRVVYPQASMHDFRVVWGVTHSNVVFDVAVPFSLKESDQQIRDRIDEAVKTLDPDYRTVLTIDREGTVNDLES